MAYCSNCGTSLALGAQFCGNCGSPITAGAPTYALAAQAAQPVTGHDLAHDAAVEGGKPGGWLIAAGYVFAILGGLLGIFLGGYLWRSKEKLANGQKVPRFNASARRHGLIIFVIAIVMIIILKNMK